MASRPTATVILATDLDGTVIPFDRDEPGKRAIAELARLVRRREDVLLAYVTGRHLALALDGIQNHELPEPHVIACDVGTSVYWRNDDGAFRRDEHYAAMMREALGNCRGVEIHEALRGLEHLTPQEGEKQAEFKASYYIGRDSDPAGVTRLVQRRLEHAGVRASLITSVDPVSGRGLLDVLPAGVSKECAVVYLQRELGVARDDVVYAGDSGNDIAALVSGFKAILVGNASAAVKADVRCEAERVGVLSHLYIAERHYAAGVLEGWAHFTNR